MCTSRRTTPYRRRGSGTPQKIIYHEIKQLVLKILKEHCSKLNGGRYRKYKKATIDNITIHGIPINSQGICHFTVKLDSFNRLSFAAQTKEGEEELRIR